MKNWDTKIDTRVNTKVNPNIDSKVNPNVSSKVNPNVSSNVNSKTDSNAYVKPAKKPAAASRAQGKISSQKRVKPLVQNWR